MKTIKVSITYPGPDGRDIWNQVKRLPSCHHPSGRFLPLAHEAQAENQRIVAAYSCRESTYYRFAERKVRGLGFIHTMGTAHRVQACLAAVEKSAGIDPKSECFLVEGISDRVVFIDPAPYWMQSTMKFSLFTIWVRLGAVYWQGRLGKAMDQYEYTADTRAVFDHFLKGNTVIMKKYSEGFVDDICETAKYHGFENLDDYLTAA